MQVDCFITQGAEYSNISCRLIERKNNIQRIEYGLKKKKKIKTAKRPSLHWVTGNSPPHPQISTEPWKKSFMKMMKPAALDCNDR